VTSVQCILFLVMLFAYSFTRTTPPVGSGVIVPNCSTHVLFLLYIFLVLYSGELFLVSYVSSVVDRYNSCCLVCDMCCCDVVAAVGRVVLCELCTLLTNTIY
jgi:hypothetical protein